MLVGWQSHQKVLKKQTRGCLKLANYLHRSRFLIIFTMIDNRHHVRQQQLTWPFEPGELNNNRSVHLQMISLRPAVWKSEI